MSQAVREASDVGQPPRDGVFPLKMTAVGSRRRTVHIDRPALIKAGFLPPEHMTRLVTNQFRHVKRPLLAAALGRAMEPVPNGRMIMVASSMPGEGKTFVSLNLAISIALERDINVVLVDADVAKPHISRLLGVESEPGLLEALQDEDLDAASLILPTDVPKLQVLPAGKPSETATELLASIRMQAVAARLGAWDKNRVVIFDSPPLLLTSESHALAQPMGQVVLVVHAGFTPQQAVHDAIACIEDDKSISLLLNQSEKGAEPGYYYGKYGSYGSATER